MAEKSTIQISGARQHNLRNLDLEIPRNQLVVVTGVSGSGKSSLALNTLYAEGQRRYVESLSAYARQFLEQWDKPDVDFIEGLSPAIAIEQRGASSNPRSTIATSTEIFDYLRLLYASLGTPHDPETGTKLERHTPHDMIEALLALPAGTRVILLAPVEAEPEDEADALAERLRQQGFLRLFCNGETHDLESGFTLPQPPPADLAIVIDRLVIRDDLRTRLADSLETALTQHPARVVARHQPPNDRNASWTETVFTTTYSNPETGFTLPALTPRHFSFNSHLGACPTCHGLGNQLVPDPTLMVPDPTLSVAEGGVKTWWSGSPKRRGYHQRGILALLEHFGLDADTPLADQPKAFKRALFHGTGKEKLKTASGARSTWNKPFEGLCEQAQRLLEESKSEVTRRNVRRFMSPQPCPDCEGRRLKPEILSVTLDHPESGPLGIHEITALSIGEALEWIESFVVPTGALAFANELVAEVRKRLAFLEDVGLHYLTLDRETGTLSGGEEQRIRLATQLGAGLAGVLYVLDEPSIGLHQRDNERLIETLRRLRDLGNSVVVVEHDEDTIRAADHVVELGPGAGEAGGRLVAQGSPEKIASCPDSPTGDYLSGRLRLEVPRNPDLTLDPSEAIAAGRAVVVRGATARNLKGFDAAFPLGHLTCVTGVSGSGKSTLVDEILRRDLARTLHRAREQPGNHAAIEGTDQLDKLIVVDQSPIGRSPRSNPATYAGVFNLIRDLYAQLPASRARGYGPGRFSFNVAGGRCEACQGDGSIRIDMHFLSDVYVTCETCAGRRYNRETLDVTYRGKSIADVLETSIGEARVFFQNIPKIHRKLKTLCDVGLEYLRLGQSATTLSGGEAQRIKLAAELSRSATRDTLYILDEPTTGLHFADIRTLLEALFRLRDQGSTLVVIEHHLDVIRCADWILDLGPGGGAEGGSLVATGTPKAIVDHPDSITGRYLAKPLA